MAKKIGLYVHIPFCIQKCKYCDFHSFCVAGQNPGQYVACLLREMEQVSGIMQDYQVDTIYLGGGTPSVLSDDQIEKISEKIQCCFSVDPQAEFTMEVNPGTVTFQGLKRYRACGINRLSMGVQALNDSLLETLGRIHHVKDFLEAYAAARIAGFDNLSFDFMFALPEQTLDDWLKTLQKAVLFQPEHLSVYGLQLEEGTELYRRRNEYHFADDELDREMYHNACRFLKGNGYEQYEISNFSRPGFASKHNLRYWEMKEYYGLGSGASSFFQNARFENPRDLQEYFNFIDNWSADFYQKDTETAEERMDEFMFLGLRKTKGVSDQDFQEQFQVSFFDRYGSVIEKHLKNGLLMQDCQRIYLSKKGLDLANVVMSDFVGLEKGEEGL